MTHATAEPRRSSSIALDRVDIHFGTGNTAVQALSGIDLQIAAGEFISILGPSGCGKSTIIGAIAGFTQPSSGELFVDGRRVKSPGSDRGVVFQQHTLFPWKTVLENVEFGLKMRGVAKPPRRHAAEEILAQVGLSEFTQHYPNQLSGGMQQRVNLARVLVNRPRVILMDEPFGALDAQTRLSMQQLLLELWHELHMTIVFVTHDVDEALYLSDRVIVLTSRPGRVKAEISIDLPRPRSYDLLTTERFMAHKREAMELLFGGHRQPEPSAPPRAHVTRPSA